jgi:ketosteroid isomerase-like protein
LAPDDPEADLMAQYSGYGKSIKLHSADELAVHHAEKRRVVILECEVHGTILATGVPYHNRLVSIITIGDKKIMHWRGYMDSVAAWNALTAPSRQSCSVN